jgi:hypothetical protein
MDLWFYRLDLPGIKIFNYLFLTLIQTIERCPISPIYLPVPNHTRHEWARVDAFIYVSDPDSLFEEYRARGVRFWKPLKDDADGLRGFEVTDADGYVLFFGRPVSDTPND